MATVLAPQRAGAAALLVLLLALITPIAHAKEIQIPRLTGRVVDQARVLNDDEERRLTARLRSLEEQTTNQLVIVTLSSLQSRPIEDWGLALGRGWGIGQKGKDNGVLLIVAPNDREVRIEVGYGLEGTLTDATASAIIRNVIIPRFKAGSMAGGISDGANAIIAVLSGEGQEFKPSSLETIGSTISQWLPVLFIGLFVFLVVVSQFSRRARRGTRYYRSSNGGWLYVDDSDRSSGWGGGGGGFSGGGGSFGGGGASGRW